MITPPKHSQGISLSCIFSSASIVHVPVAPMTALTDRPGASTHTGRPSSVPACGVPKNHGMMVKALNVLTNSLRCGTPVYNGECSSFPQEKVTHTVNSVYSVTDLPFNCAANSGDFIGIHHKVKTSRDLYTTDGLPSPVCKTETCIPPAQSLIVSSPLSADNFLESVIRRNVETTSSLSHRDLPIYTSLNSTQEISTQESLSCPSSQVSALTTTCNVHFPDVCATAEGGFWLDLPNNISLPVTCGPQRSHRLNLMDVIVTVVDRTGNILFHKCYFTGTCLLPNDRLRLARTKWVDHVCDTYVNMWNSHFTQALDSFGQLADCDSPKVLSGPLCCPDYQVQLVGRRFSIRTFSFSTCFHLPTNGGSWTSITLDFNPEEPVVVHYHSVLHECSGSFSDSNCSVKPELRNSADDRVTPGEVKEFITQLSSCNRIVDGMPFSPLFEGVHCRSPVLALNETPMQPLFSTTSNGSILGNSYCDPLNPCVSMSSSPIPYRHRLDHTGCVRQSRTVTTTEVPCNSSITRPTLTPPKPQCDLPLSNSTTLERTHTHSTFGTTARSPDRVSHLSHSHVGLSSHYADINLDQIGAPLSMCSPFPTSTGQPCFEQLALSISDPQNSDPLESIRLNIRPGPLASDRKSANLINSRHRHDLNTAAAAINPSNPYVSQTSPSPIGPPHTSTQPPQSHQSQSSTVPKPMNFVYTRSSKPSHDPQHGERAVLLQNLLPAEAVQQIRLIWEEIYGAGNLSAKQVVDRSVYQGAQSRELFARRVRQVVRQHLGPNALNHFTRRTPMDSPASSSSVLVKSVRLAEISSATQEPSNMAVSGQCRREPHQYTSSDCVAESSSISPSLLQSSNSLSCFSTKHDSGHHISQENKMSAIPQAQTPASLVQSQSRTAGNDFPTSNNGSPRGIHLSSSYDRLHQLPDKPARPTVSSPDLRPIGRASGSNQCCMLEWLLSEESDLGLLPASFFESKVESPAISTSVKHLPVDSSSNIGGSYASHLSGSGFPSSMTPNQPSTVHMPLGTKGRSGSGLHTTVNSVVSPINVATTSLEQAFLSSPTSTISYLPGTSIEHEKDYQCAAVATSAATSSPCSSVNSGSSPTSWKSSSLLVRLLHPSTPTSLHVTNKCRLTPLVGSEPCSPCVAQSHLEPLTGRPSESGLNHQLVVNVRNPDFSVSTHTSSPMADRSFSETAVQTGRCKRRRSGPPTPKSSTSPDFSTPVRMRHVSSQVETYVNRSDNRRSSSPITSLTQLLLQDFPSTNSSDSSDGDFNSSVGNHTPLVLPPHQSLRTKSIDSPQCLSNCVVVPESHTPLSNHNQTINSFTYKSVVDPGDFTNSSVTCGDQLKSPTTSFALFTSASSTLEMPEPYSITNRSRQPNKPGLLPSGTSVAVTTPTTSTSSSLCRLLLDPYSGSQETTGCFQPSVSKPVNMKKSDEVLESSKTPSHDVYDFSAASNESKGSPFSRSTESLSDAVFLEPPVIPTSSVGSSLISKNVSTSLRELHEASVGSLHPPATGLSPKALAEEVEFLYEILRRDELNRDTPRDLDIGSPESKRTRLRIQHSSFNSLSSGDTDAASNASSPTDVQAVARICEQLQEGFTSRTAYSSQCPSGSGSNFSQVMGPVRLPASPLWTSACSRSTQPAETVSSHISVSVLPFTSAQPIGGWSSDAQVSRKVIINSCISNEAAVAAAKASQIAAAHQRRKLTTQHLIEQRKRLLQHQMYNQMTVYSPSPGTSTAISPEVVISPPTANSAAIGTSPLMRTRPKKMKASVGHAISANTSVSQGSKRTGPTLSDPNIPDQSRCITLTATTVVSQSTTNVQMSLAGSNFTVHRPEDLVRYLREVGPNIQVQLSQIPFTNNGGCSTARYSPPVNRTIGHSKRSCSTTSIPRSSRFPASNTPVTWTDPSSSHPAPPFTDTTTPVYLSSPPRGSFANQSMFDGPVSSSGTQVASLILSEPIAASRSRIRSAVRSRGSGVVRRRCSPKSPLIQSVPRSSIQVRNDGQSNVESPIKNVPFALDTQSSSSSLLHDADIIHVSMDSTKQLQSALPSTCCVKSDCGTELPSLFSCKSQWFSANQPTLLAANDGTQVGIDSGYVVGYAPSTVTVLEPTSVYCQLPQLSTPARSITSDPTCTPPVQPIPTDSGIVASSVDVSAPQKQSQSLTGHVVQIHLNSAPVLLCSPSLESSHNASVPHNVVLQTVHPNPPCIPPLKSEGQSFLSHRRSPEMHRPIHESERTFLHQDVAGFTMDFKHEDSLLPEDIINDVFDLETMVAAKQQENLFLHEPSSLAPDGGIITTGNRSDYLINTRDLDAADGLVTFPSTASSSPSPCSPRLGSSLPSDSRSFLCP